MAQFVLERVIRATPEQVFAASLDPALHVRSMAAHGETMEQGPTGGVFTEGSTVTWRARHFGVPFRLSTVVYDIDAPRRFCDRQTAGPFRDFQHEHVFEPHRQGTLMRDTVTFRSPFGVIGTLVDRLFLRAYMSRLIARRNAVLAAEAEASAAAEA